MDRLIWPQLRTIHSEQHVSLSRHDSREHQTLFFRYAEIDAELAELSEGRVVDGDPAELEQRLLAEQDEIEFQLGESYIEGRDQLADE